MQYITEAILISVLTGVGTWFAARKRNRAEVKKIDIENIELVNTAVNKKAEIMDAQIVQMLELINQLREENLSLKQTIYDLQMQVLNLKNITGEKYINPNSSPLP